MKCNLGCEYCYEEPDRHHSADAIKQGYDINAIIDQLEDWYEDNPEYPPGFHGGEPLLLDFDDLERLLTWITDHYGKDQGSHIQTNATRLEERHVSLFEEHNVSVGVSFDGPDELNSLRKARSEDDAGDITGEMTSATRDALERLIESDIGVGVIIVLTTQNAGTDEKIERLYEFIDYLNRNDVGGHFNPAIPYEDVQTDVSLDPEQLKKVYLYGWEWMKEESYRRWNPMRQYQDNLLGLALGNCVNKKCDVFNAEAAEIVQGNGELTGCGKTWSTVGDGVSFLQGESTGNEFGESVERYEMLKQVPGWVTEGEEDQGGCKGCKYWRVCHGGCPSSGIDYDYRNRSIWCEAKYALYERIEQDMRAMFPAVQLVTDLPWDVSHLDDRDIPVDVKPFGRMRQSGSDDPSVTGNSSKAGNPADAVKGKLEFDELVELYKDKYPEEILTIKPQENSIHADTHS